MVDFGLEDGYKTIFAELLVIFRPDYKGPGGLTDSAEGWRHHAKILPPLGISISVWGKRWRPRLKDGRRVMFVE